MRGKTDPTGFSPPLAVLIVHLKFHSFVGAAGSFQRTGFCAMHSLIAPVRNNPQEIGVGSRANDQMNCPAN